MGQYLHNNTTLLEKRIEGFEVALALSGQRSPDNNCSVYELALDIH